MRSRGRIHASRLANAAALAAVVALLRGAAGPTRLLAEEVAVSLDPQRTTIAFSLGATLHTVHGSFKLKSGALRFDTATGGVRGEVVVDTHSGESGNASRDKRMRDEILETGRFPTAVFRPDRFEGRLLAEGDSRGNLRGRLELHGTAHEILIPVRIQSSAGKAVAAARFEIPYVQWGLKDPSTLLLRVKDRVSIEIHATVDPLSEKPAAAASTAFRRYYRRNFDGSFLAPSLLRETEFETRNPPNERNPGRLRDPLAPAHRMRD